MGMVLVVIGLFMLALSAVNGAKRLADRSRYSASTIDIAYPLPNSDFSRYESPDSKAGPPTYDMAVLLTRCTTGLLN